jgi:pSer/pThr/pTyr-binding forkhead associated (FHA) protein
MTPPAATVPSLVPQGQHLGKPALPLGRPFTLVGSRHRAHLHLLSRSVSKSHAAIIGTDSGLYVRDLASREHVFVNGVPVKEADLKNGDLLQIGTFTFKYSDPSARSRPRAGSRAGEAVLQVDGANIPIPIDGRSMVIGRRPTCDISLVEPSASTIHAIIFEVNGQRYIRDLGSRTGTFVNGRPIHHHPLQLNDQIKVGETEMRYAIAGAASEADDLEHILGTVPIGVTDEPLDLDGLDFDEPAVPVPVEEPEPATAIAAREAARRALEQVNRTALEQQAHVEPAPISVHEDAPIPIVTDDDLIPLSADHAAVQFHAPPTSPLTLPPEEPSIAFQGEQGTEAARGDEQAGVPLEPLDLDEWLSADPRHPSSANESRATLEPPPSFAANASDQHVEPEPLDLSTEHAGQSPGEKLDFDIWSDEPSAAEVTEMPKEASVAFAPDAQFTTSLESERITADEPLPTEAAHEPSSLPEAPAAHEEPASAAEPFQPAERLEAIQTIERGLTVDAGVVSERPLSEPQLDEPPVDQTPVPIEVIEPTPVIEPVAPVEHAEPIEAPIREHEAEIARAEAVEIEPHAPVEDSSWTAAADIATAVEHPIVEEPAPALDEAPVVETPTVEAPAIEPPQLGTEVRPSSIPLEIELPVVPADPAAAVAAILGGAVALPSGKKKPPRNNKKREPKAPAVKPAPVAKAPPARGRGRKKAQPVEPTAQRPAMIPEPAAPIEAEQPANIVETPFSESPVPPVALPAAEIIEPTEPIPESAQVLEPGILETDGLAIESEPSLAVPAEEDALALSDTRFGRVVEEFAGPELGPLVEERAEPAPDEREQAQADTGREPEAETREDLIEEAPAPVSLQEQSAGTATDEIDISSVAEVVPSAETAAASESFYEAEPAPEWVAHMPATDAVIESPLSVAPAAEVLPVVELGQPATEVESPEIAALAAAADIIADPFVTEPAVDAPVDWLGSSSTSENDALVKEATAFLAHEELEQPPLPTIDEVVAPASADVIELAASVDSSVIPLDAAIEAVGPADSLVAREAPLEIAELRANEEPKQATAAPESIEPLAGLEELKLAPDDFVPAHEQQGGRADFSLADDEESDEAGPIELASGPSDESFDDLEFAPEPLTLLHQAEKGPAVATDEVSASPAAPISPTAQSPDQREVSPPAPVSRARQFLTLEPEPLASPDDLRFELEPASGRGATTETPVAPAARAPSVEPSFDPLPLPPPPPAPSAPAASVAQAQRPAPLAGPSGVKSESIEESIAPMSLDDLMAGMSRDFGSFLGGLPLGMAPTAPTAPVAPPVGRGVVIEAKRNPPAQQPPSSQRQQLHPAPIGRAPLDVPPPADGSELFDGAPGLIDELPDALDEIAHETQVVGETAPPIGTPPARPQPPVPPARPKPPVVPPPPARSARRPAAQAAPQTEHPEFGLPGAGEFGAPNAPRGKPSSAFDGLAMPAAASVDVFSMLPIPGDGDPFLSGNGRGGIPSKQAPPSAASDSQAAASAPTGERPAPSRRPLPPPPQAQSPQQQPPARRAAAPRPAADLPAQNQNIVTNIPPTGGGAGESSDPKRRKWRFFGSVLLPLLCLGGAGATYAFWPSTTHLRAALRFDGLEKLTLREQGKTLQKVAEQLNHSPSVRQTAQDSLAASNPGLSPGFLDAGANPIAFDRVAQSAHADGGKSFVIEFNTRDPQGDSARAAALLRALYAENKSLADHAATLVGRHEKAQRDLDAVQLQVSELEKQRKTDADATLQRAAATETERHSFTQAQEAERTWLAASRKVRALQDELDTLEAGQAALDADPQVKDLRARLGQLDATLAAAHGEQGKDGGKAAAAIELAIAEFDKQIGALHPGDGKTPDGSLLASFLSAASAARQQLKFATAELTSRQTSDDQSLANLKTRLADKAQSRFRAIWSADAKLTQLQQRAMVLDRQINTATDSNLPDEASRLQGQAQDLKGQIDHRRAELAGNAADPEQQKLIDEMVRQMRVDQQNGLARLREPLQLLTTAADAARGDASLGQTLSADQRAAIDRVVHAAGQVRTAAEGYVATVNSNVLPPQFNVPEMEAQRTQLAAQLEARRKQLASQNADAINGSEGQKAALLRTGQDLATARQLEGRALAERNLARQELAQAEAVLAQLPRGAGSLVADDQQLAQFQQRRESLGREIEQLAATPIIIPQDPNLFDNNSVLVEPPDPRPRLLATTAVLALGLLGSWAFWLYGVRPAQPLIAEPYAPPERQMIEGLNEDQALPA